jgi:hypothetical protein
MIVKNDCRRSPIYYTTFGDPSSNYQGCQLLFVAKLDRKFSKRGPKDILWAYSDLK